MKWDEYVEETLGKVDTTPEDEQLIIFERDQARQIIYSLGYNLNAQRVQSITKSPSTCYAICTINSMYGIGGVIRFLKLKRIKGIE